MKYLEDLIKGLVDFPTEVQIFESRDDMGVLYSISADPLDVGRIIGKAGDTIHAIRKIMACHGTLKRQTISVKVLQPREVPIG